MYLETWNKLMCPACKATNWLCAGDLDDQTVPDIEACQCWKCKKAFLIVEESEIDEGNERTEKGLRKPT